MLKLTRTVYVHEWFKASLLSLNFKKLIGWGDDIKSDVGVVGCA